jgi:25S rRNA (adenine2142-N1)-methyltransferase
MGDITYTHTNKRAENMPKRKRVVALAPPPLQSRRKARQITTLFHKLTRQRDAALESKDAETVARLDRLIDGMGGRAAYQKASQVSTSFHSTSKWVLGVLSRTGWLYGIQTDTKMAETEKSPRERKKNSQRRVTRLLEVGAINTELLDAASQTAENMNDGCDVTTKYKLHVRAVDINSIHPGIEEADFLTMPLVDADESRYDVIVCSMVLNCVTTPAARGDMITRLYHFLSPGGLLFVTVPKSCLTLSPYMNRERFRQLLQYVGFEVKEAKESPRICFFLCEKNKAVGHFEEEASSKWSEQPVIYRGKKYKNDFSVTLSFCMPKKDSEKHSSKLV